MEVNIEKSKAGLISIIVPVYNVERYLRHTLDSILHQSFPDWEMLLINDGSSDASGAICDEYASKDRRIKVFHNQNHGVSYSRNYGIMHSRGEYICFCDSDDLFAPDFLKRMYTRISSSEADIIGCRSRNIDDHVTAYQAGGDEDTWTVYDGDDLGGLPDEYFYVIWGKLYRKELIISNKLWFNTDMNRGEDTLFAYETALYCNKIVYGNARLVNYRVRQGSLMHSKPSVSLYTQSVIKLQSILNREYHDINASVYGKVSEDASMALLTELCRSCDDSEAFRKNYHDFINSPDVLDEVRKRAHGFPARLRISLAIIISGGSWLPYRVKMFLIRQLHV